MDRKQIRNTTVVAFALVAIWTGAGNAPAGQAGNLQISIFEYDPGFPKPLPENWAIGR